MRLETAIRCLMRLETANRRWAGCCAVVMATGPSLSDEQIETCRKEHVIAVNNAMLAAPWAEIGYFCDSEWFLEHKGCREFDGELWTSHSRSPSNDKRAIAKQYDLHIIAGKDESGFSTDNSFIHYGRNSGFQAVNLALLFGANPIILIGFDMRKVGVRDHYFGNHPSGLRAPGPFSLWIEAFQQAAAVLPKDIRILNATPESALDCFPMVDLEDALV